MRALATLSLILVSCLALAACGGEDAGDTTAQPGTAAAEDTATAEAGGEASTIPTTPVVATLEEGYKVVNGNPEDAAADELPVQPGSVAAWWYRAGDRYAVVYAGLSLEDLEAPLCPGNSILIETSFDHVSNSPTGEGGCGGSLADNAPSEGRGVVACGPLLIYETDIPSDAEGTLYASVERFESGAIVGVTSVVRGKPADAPAIELGAGSYTIPAEALPDGATEVTC